MVRRIGAGAEDETLVARMVVSANALLLETNSENRSKAARSRIEKACTGMLRFETLEVKGLFDHEPSDDGADDPMPIAEAAMIRELKNEYYRKWLDTRIPALGDLTPR